MSKYKFIKIKDETNPFDTTNVKIETEAVTLDQLLEDFTDFLRACGFVLKDGNLEVVYEKE